METASEIVKKSFIFTGNEVFSRGQGQFEIRENALILRKDAVYTSEIADSGQGGMRWNNAVLDIEMTEGSFFRFTAFCSDLSPTDGEKISNDFLQNCESVSFVNADTVPLSTLSGRWLIFTLEAFPEGTGEIVVNSVRLTCPHKSYIEFMPQVFRRLDNGTLQNLLDIYKVAVDDIDSEIVNIDRILNPDLLSGDKLLRLAEWVGLDIGLLWGEEKLRALIKEAYYFNLMKGTSAALSRMIEILIGKKPKISEVSRNGKASFTVTVDRSDVISGQHYSDIVRLIDLMKPAGVQGRLVLRKPDEDVKKNDAITLSDSTDSAILLSDDSFDSGFIL